MDSENVMQLDNISNSSFETLPIELQMEILGFAPDVSTLYTMIGASPAYHHTYLDNRRKILSTVLATEIPADVLFEAMVCVAVGKIKRKEESELEVDWLNYVTIFLRDARARYSKTPVRDLETLIDIPRLYGSVQRLVMGTKACLLSPARSINEPTSYQDLPLEEQQEVLRQCFIFLEYCRIHGDKLVEYLKRLGYRLSAFGEALYAQDEWKQLCGDTEPIVLSNT